MSKRPQPSRPRDTRPAKDEPKFPNPPKRRKLADLEAALDPRDVSAARQLGTPEHLPLTPQAQSVLTALYRTDRPVAA